MRWLLSLWRPVASSSRTVASCASTSEASPASEATSTAALARRRVIRVGKIEPQSPAADLDALQVPECRRGRVGVAIFTKSETFGFPRVVVKDESAIEHCQARSSVLERESGKAYRKETTGPTELKT